MGQKNIPEIWRSCKIALDEALSGWGTFVFIGALALCCFGLGRLSIVLEERSPLILSHAQEVGGPIQMHTGGEVVASKSGAVYYFPWCSAAQHIESAKQVWFTSESAAEAAGYRAAKNCKGLINE